MYLGKYGFGDGLEGSLHLLVVFGIDFDEIQTAFFGQCVSLIKGDDSLLFKVIFIANEKNFHVRVSVHFDLIEPVFDMGESLFSGDVINKKRTDGTTVVWASDGPKILLAGSVPDLQLYIFVLDRDCLSSKLNSNGYIMSGAGFTLNELEDDTGLADASVTDNDELKKVMIGVHYLEWGIIEFIITY